MKIKAAFIFFTTIVLYCITVYSSSYIGVYFSYIAVPVILISGYIMIFYKSKEKSTSMISVKNFDSTITDNLSSLATIKNSKVDGNIAKEDRQNKINTARTAVTETLKATSNVLEDGSRLLANLSNEIDIFNQKTELKKSRTKDARDRLLKLKLKKAEPEVRLKYAKDYTERHDFLIIINKIEEEIEEIVLEIAEIEKQCEIDIVRRCIAQQ